MSATANSMLRLTRAVRAELRPLRFRAPVSHVYSPLDYAWQAHARYLRLYAAGPKRVLLLGMNPGPFGMVQTGVPFGEVEMVRRWIGIEERIDQPARLHPKRPVLGFECRRSEVSGRRLWSWCEARFGTAPRFFAKYYVHNYCPLAFMESSGRNLTPDKLPAAARERLFGICDRYLQQVVELLRPGIVVGVGAFAEKRARQALSGCELAFGRIPHPSPASPAANRGWAEAADRAFAELGIAPR